MYTNKLCRNEFRFFFEKSLTAVQLYVLTQSLKIEEYVSILEIGDINCDTSLCEGILVSIGGEPISDYINMMKKYPFIKSIQSFCDNPSTDYSSQISISRDDTSNKPNVYLIENM